MTDRVQKGELVLVTGASGLIGGGIANELLKMGFKVRGTTRDASKENQLQEHFDKTYGKGAFEWVEVKDAVQPGAYAEALKGVSGVIHVASDTSMSANYEQVVNTAVNLTLGILESSLLVPSVKSIVVTSSREALYTPSYGADEKLDLKDYNEKAVKLAETAPATYPYLFAYVYSASKTKAEQAVWNFVKEKKPHFAVNCILPETVSGAVTNPAPRVYSTSTWLGEVFQGNKQSMIVAFANPSGHIIDVQDVALIHIGALLAPDVDGQRLWAAAHKWTLDEVLAIWKEAYPVKELPSNFDFQAGPKWQIDNSKSTELVKRYGGRDYISLKDTALATVKHLV